ncbi:uroporphyrinogen-III C-methyltransferase [Flavihumibacter petaseus]|uniref:uroporphyrinogen-III C-methyltransferase n=1 Tax=Flavihumibacter petaseus NBRC 106054 TaxID=1220578 RepID=A0A0E9N4R9_9BACT|nr:uroporphyrinogen-III C-methyltransferase [Flavihumibacter petaseus]GAO44829.1 uroporphyrinogen-III C-methyltransferase [Flavihumibacter petaseus NBRC 106054]
MHNTASHLPFLSLVGAGPGDPELITVKAIRVLSTARVILYDALVNTALLDYTPASSLKIFVGKRYGCHTLSQQEINDHIIAYAKSHGHVVRLKGGDPFVFGRAAEELEAAAAAGIPSQVIPGISSALAVPAAAGIPLTIRGCSESIWVTTGTTRNGDISCDIALAAQSSATVVILMAMSRLEEIMEIFAMHGKAHLPVAIIQNGTHEVQKIITGTVRDIAFRSTAAGLSNPAIIVVGEVVNFPQLLQQVEKQQKGLHLAE